MRRLWILLFVVAIGGIAPTAAHEDEEEPLLRPPPLRNLWVFGIGPSYWTDVHRIDPSGSPFADQLGLFHTWGAVLELAYQRRVGRLGGVDILVGIDLGAVSHENSADLDVQLIPFGNTVDGGLEVRAQYVTPSFRAVLGGGGRWRYLFGAGAGYYDAEILQTLDDFWDADRLFSEDSFGGYVSFGADYRLWRRQPRWHLRFESKVHSADFGSTDRYAPDSGDLTGPIDTLVVGFVLSH